MITDPENEKEHRYKTVKSAGRAWCKDIFDAAMDFRCAQEADRYVQRYEDVDSARLIINTDKGQRYAY